jgi:hypothetical protein
MGLRESNAAKAETFSRRRVSMYGTRNLILVRKQFRGEW